MNKPLPETYNHQEPNEKDVVIDGSGSEFLEEKRISTKNGITYTGSVEKYISAMQRYLRGYEKNRSALEELFAAEDTEGFMIRDHALKSNSRMIGASEVAE